MDITNSYIENRRKICGLCIFSNCGSNNKESCNPNTLMCSANNENINTFISNGENSCPKGNWGKFLVSGGCGCGK